LWEYQQEFERLANRVDGWPQKALVGTFLGGLKNNVVSAVWMFKPKTLRDAIELARMRDDNLSKDRKTARGVRLKPQHTKSFPKTTHSIGLTFSTGYPSNTTWPYSSRAAKKLSWEEMQKRREKGLCFGCNEKFTPRYRCQTPRALSIEVYALEEKYEELEDCDTESGREAQNRRGGTPYLTPCDRWL